MKLLEVMMIGLIIGGALLLLNDLSLFSIAAPGDETRESDYTLNYYTVISDNVNFVGNHTIRWEYEWTWRGVTTKSIGTEDFKTATDSKQLAEVEKRTHKRIQTTIKNTQKEENKNPPPCTLCTGPRPPTSPTEPASEGTT